MDNTVLKFNHCGRIIFSFDNEDKTNNVRSEPKRCPICRELMRFSLLEAPVIVPSPFSNGHKAPRAFLVGSVQGPAFLSEGHDTELHVGITNSKGVVYSYTLSGIQRDDHGWEQCMKVPLVAPETGSGELWDSQLEQLSLDPTWSPHRFHEEREFGSCCYGFALAFINHMRRTAARDTLSRDLFTAQHVLPRVKTTSTYIRVYQEISQHGFYIADH